MILFVLRGLVLVIITAISVLYLLANQQQGGFTYDQFLLMLAITLGLAGLASVRFWRRRLSRAMPR